MAEPMHCIGKVRQQRGISLRHVARQPGAGLRTVQRQEMETTDLRLSELLAWQGVLCVPLVDLLVEPDQQKVGRVVAHEVELGPIVGERIEISAGLSDGVLLIVRGQDRVVAGDQVKYQTAFPAPLSPAPGEQTERELP